ncbi:MAG: type II toxin-antitoxin system RelE family toxin [Desulfobaccales bacterium]
MKESLSYPHKAKKAVEKLDKNIVRRIRDRLRELAVDPYNPPISKDMETEPGKCYSRIGDWRVIYRLDENEKNVDAGIIQHRSKAYKEMKR